MAKIELVMRAQFRYDRGHSGFRLVSRSSGDIRPRELQVECLPGFGTSAHEAAVQRTEGDRLKTPAAVGRPLRSICSRVMTTTGNAVVGAFPTRETFCGTREPVTTTVGSTFGSTACFSVAGLAALVAGVAGAGFFPSEFFSSVAETELAAQRMSAVRHPVARLGSWERREAGVFIKPNIGPLPEAATRFPKNLWPSEMPSRINKKAETGCPISAVRIQFKA